MSRNSRVIENPSVKTLKWKNEKRSKGEIVRESGWYYWDKTANDGKGEDRMVKMPLNFIWLESAQSFGGFNDKENKGIYSNEILVSKDAVDKYGKQKLLVKCGDKELANGYYADIKETVKGFGGKFCIPVYAMVEVDNQWEIWRILMIGASASAWMTFNKTSSNITHAISCSGKREVEMKTGATYDEPLFTYIPMDSATSEKASGMCDKVEEYFDYILSNKPIIEDNHIDTSTESHDETDF